MPEPMTTMGSSSRHTAGCARAAGRRLVRSQVPWRPSAPTRSAVAAIMFENGAREGRGNGLTDKPDKRGQRGVQDTENAAAALRRSPTAQALPRAAVLRKIGRPSVRAIEEKVVLAAGSLQTLPALPGLWIRAVLSREISEAAHRCDDSGAVGLAVVHAVAIVVERLHRHLIHPVQLAPRPGQHGQVCALRVDLQPLDPPARQPLPEDRTERHSRHAPDLDAPSA